MNEYGKKVWVIPDMYWPLVTSKGHYVSHESICVLNTSAEVCDITIDLYFEDRAPQKGLKSRCDAMRTHHIRMDALKDELGEPVVPRGIPYAAIVYGSIPVVVQYTRVDTTQSANALMTVMAY